MYIMEVEGVHDEVVDVVVGQQVEDQLCALGVAHEDAQGLNHLHLRKAFDEIRIQSGGNFWLVG
jgi:hypothetical protein